MSGRSPFVNRYVTPKSDNKVSAFSLYFWLFLVFLSFLFPLLHFFICYSSFLFNLISLVLFISYFPSCFSFLNLPLIPLSLPLSHFLSISPLSTYFTFLSLRLRLLNPLSYIMLVSRLILRQSIHGITYTLTSH